MASVVLESPHVCGLSGGLRVAEGPQGEGTEGVSDGRGARGQGRPYGGLRGLWTQAGLREPSSRRERGPGGPRRKWGFQSLQATCSNIRYQMIISFQSVGLCSLGGVHLLSSSQAGEEKGCPLLSGCGGSLQEPMAPSWGDTGLAGGKLGASE